jgi:hypothetical protein
MRPGVSSPIESRRPLNHAVQFPVAPPRVSGQAHRRTRGCATVSLVTHPHTRWGCRGVAGVCPTPYDRPGLVPAGVLGRGSAHWGSMGAKVPARGHVGLQDRGVRRSALLYTFFAFVNPLVEGLPRQGAHLRGRPVTGESALSGFGEAAMARALADPTGSLNSRRTHPSRRGAEARSSVSGEASAGPRAR